MLREWEKDAARLCGLLKGDAVCLAPLFPKVARVVFVGSIQDNALGQLCGNGG